MHIACGLPREFCGSLCQKQHINPAKWALRTLGVVLDDQLNFTDHIATTACSCRFSLNNIRKIKPFLSEHTAQLLVQALVALGALRCSSCKSQSFHNCEMISLSGVPTFETKLVSVQKILFEKGSYLLKTTHSRVSETNFRRDIGLVLPKISGFIYFFKQWR